MDLFSIPISDLKGVGSFTAAKLARHGLEHLRDLLLLRPKRIEYLPLVTKLEGGKKIAVRVTVGEIKYIRKGVSVICIGPEQQEITALSIGPNSWFKSIPVGSEWIISGIFSLSPKPTIVHPEWAKEWQEYRPVYPTFAGMSQSRLRNLILQVIEKTKDIDDPIIQALYKMHTCDKDFSHCIKQIADSEARVYREEISKAKVGKAQIFTEKKPLLSSFSFKLTGDQKSAIQDILNDLQKELPMSRLLQGDVGSGKTIVALSIADYVAQCGFQSLIMAPTSVLASQHYQNAKKFLSFPVFLFTSKAKKSERLEIMKFDGPAVIVGTHALVYAEVFPKVAFAVVDEQHKFGVQQRLKLRQAGVHALSMSATPIPRSLYLASKGYLGISTLREKPSEKPEIQTYIKSELKIEEVYRWIREVLNSGLLVYWVCPRIIEDPNIEMANVQRRSQELEKYFEGKIGVMHGQLADKQSVLEDFQSGKKPVLVSTTVIEVGIDIAEAKGIVIEQAEQYGLAQLHQLRGRVGRGKHEGVCILLYRDRASWYSVNKLKVLKQYQDGFEIAAKDQELRGHGDILGNLQSGASNFKFFDIKNTEPEGPPTDLERALWKKDGNLIHSV